MVPLRAISRLYAPEAAVVPPEADTSHTDGLDLDRRNRELAAAKSAEPRGRALPKSAQYGDN